jgi:predicted phage-related endonuclease
MEIHNLVQGTDAWHQFRATHFGASEAAAMLGLSPKVKRTELLHMKHTGSAKEFSDWVQKNILDYGHEVEALARPMIEEIIGEDLYPVTCSDGHLSASCDGLTMTEDTVFEHKQWNEALATLVRAGVVPDEHMPQCQQLLMITRANRVLFTVSDGTPERLVYTEVSPDPDWFQRIKDGWAQFAKDLECYVPIEYAEKPQPAAIMRLPSLAVQIRGEVVTSNLPAFRDAATTFIASIKTDLETDEDFANADAAVKFCDGAERDLEAAKAAALGQTASIDDLMKTIDFIRDQLRTKRLTLEKLVTAKKTSIKEGAIAKAREAYASHIESLEKEIHPVKLVIQPGPDFPGGAKNKRTLASLHDALDTELANAKIKADAAAKAIRANLAWYEDNVDDCKFLFADLGTLALKEADDFHLVVTTRITAHRQAEEERKRAEDAAKATAAAAIEQAAKPAPDVQGTSPLFPVVAAPSPGGSRALPAKNEPPSLKLGQIGERLGFSLTAEFLRNLGFEASGRERNAVLYHERDFDRICQTLITHITTVRAEQRKAA